MAVASAGPYANNLQTVCTSLQTDNHTTQAGCSSWLLTDSVKALKQIYKIQSKMAFLNMTWRGLKFAVQFTTLMACCRDFHALLWRVKVWVVDGIWHCDAYGPFKTRSLENFEFGKLQHGGWPPTRKIEISVQVLRHIWPKFGLTVQNASLKRTGRMSAILDFLHSYF